ncbi:MAG: PAS domain-containing protein [Alphaproteobacteria bacterium]|nr:PAS domain-containing protein [Alphaproteobacteria bacterium]
MNQGLGFRDTIADPSLAGLYDHWRRLVEKLGRLPRRSEIDPIDLPRALLPGMMVIEREETGRFLCRLAGTRLREIMGFEPTGRYVDEIMSPIASDLRMSMYTQALNEKRAVFCRMRFAVPGKEFVACDRLYVPALGDETGVPTVLFGAQLHLMASDVVGQPDERGVYSISCDSPVTV